MSLPFLSKLKAVLAKRGPQLMDGKELEKMKCKSNRSSQLLKVWTKYFRKRLKEPKKKI
jgi:hypothetical protein